MTFTLEITSEFRFKEKVEVKTLDDLKKIQDSYKYQGPWEDPKLIIDFNEMTIEVYDDYRE